MEAVQERTIKAVANKESSHTASPQGLPLSPMTSNAYWSDACELAVDRPLETLVKAVYTSSGVTVR